MWQQILIDPACRAVSGGNATVLNFPASLREEMTPAERLVELERWSERVASEENPGWFDARVTAFLARERAELIPARHEESERAENLQNGVTWLQGVLDGTRGELACLEGQVRDLELGDVGARDRAGRARGRAGSDPGHGPLGAPVPDSSASRG